MGIQEAFLVVGLGHRGTTRLTYNPFRGKNRCMDEKQKQKISILFPVDILKDIREQAKRDERSFNGEVIWILRDYIRQRKGEQKHDEGV